MARTRYIKAKKKTLKVHIDMISELPESLIETILSHLTLREAVRTSILSTKWRYMWTNLPKLVFDEVYRLQNSSEQLTMIIHKVLRLHDRPVLEFTLDVNELRPSDEVDELLSCLSKKYVEKLTLQFWRDEYILPASLFSCLKLTHLDLGYCVFQLPSTFRGFSHIVSLKLEHVEFDGEEFGSFLTTCCPNLETLSLNGCNFSRLEVSALKLKSFCFIGNTDSVCLKNVPNVEMVSIQPEINVHGDSIKFSATSSDLFEPLDDADGYVPEGLPRTLIQLKNLKSFDISFRTLENVLEFLSLSSNLRRFTMLLFDTDTGFIEENFVSEKWIHLSLYQLEQVEIYRISGRPTEMEFIELLLSISPVLQKVKLEATSSASDEIVNIFGDLLRLKRASPNVEIILLQQDLAE